MFFYSPVRDNYLSGCCCCCYCSSLYTCHPRCFSYKHYLPSIFIASCTNERSLLFKCTPWQNSRFSAASALHIIVSYLSSLIRACAKPQAGVSPPRRSPPCIYYMLYVRKNENTKTVAWKPSKNKWTPSYVALSGFRKIIISLHEKIRPASREGPRIAESTWKSSPETKRVWVSNLGIQHLFTAFVIRQFAARASTLTTYGILLLRLPSDNVQRVSTEKNDEETANKGVAQGYVRVLLPGIPARCAYGAGSNCYSLMLVT